MLREIIKGGSYVAISAIGIKILNLVYTPLLARWLGPTGFGTYNLALILIPWVVIIASLGMEATLTRIIAQQNDSEPNTSGLIKTAYVLATIASLTSVTIFLLLASKIGIILFKTADPFLLKLAAPGIIAGGFCTVTLGILRGKKQFAHYAIFDFTRQLSIVLLGISLLVLGFGVKGAVIANFAGPLIVIAIAVMFLLKSFGANQNTSFSKNSALLFRTGAWIVPLSFMTTIFDTLDRFVLGSLLSEAAVGIYVSAFTLVGGFVLLISSLKGGLFPFISEQVAIDQKKTANYISQTLKYALIASGAVIITLIALNKTIINILFGSAYTVSADILIVLSLVVLFKIIWIFLHTTLLAICDAKKIILPVLIAVAISVVTYYFLIKSFGVFGAAMALNINYLVLIFAYYLTIRKTIFINYSEVTKLSLLIVGLAALTAALKLIVNSQIVFVSMLAVYTLISLKLLSKEERTKLAKFAFSIIKRLRKPCNNAKTNTDKV